MGTDLEVIDKTYDFILWAVPKVNKFPRDHRFTIGERLCQRLYDFLSEEVEARYDRERRAETLRKMARDLTVVRLLFRLAKDLKLIDLKAYEYAAERMEEIGRLLGGWMKAVQAR